MDQNKRNPGILPPPLADNLQGFSAPFSSWFLFIPARVLLDAGEGVASRLGNRVYLPEMVLLSHAHYDHIAGLPGFLLARATARGDSSKPVRIFYPAAAERSFLPIRDYVNRLVKQLTFPVEWKAAEPGMAIPIRHWIIEPFATHHGTPSLGYRFLEERQKLKAEYHELSGPDIAALKKQGVEVQKRYRHILLAFTGDTGPGLEPSLFEKADVLVHEANFLRPEDREGQYHSTVEEALIFAREARVKVLVLYHLSQRYCQKDIADTIPLLRRKVAYLGHVTVVTGYTSPDGFYE